MQTLAQSTASFVRAAGRLIILHRHDIADALMVVAVVLKTWPDKMPVPAVLPKKLKSRPNRSS